MNSIDAKATSCDIKITKDGYTINDDGIGFTTRKEIEECFEVFCFNHDEDSHRVYGKFGMGRGQLWAWSSSVWRTDEFVMDVDIKNRGLEYLLKEGQEPVKGCIITGKFYEPLMPSDQESTIRELKELAKYAQIPVKLNGKVISTPANKEKWTVETDDAYISIKEGMSSLKVYNLGVLVRSYGSYQVGCGGTVVSKKDLTLNFARNDILMAKCEVWKRIKKYLQKRTNDRVKKKTRLSEEERQNLIDQLKSGDIAYDQVSKQKLIFDTTGKAWEVQHLEYKVRLLTVEPESGSQLAEQVQLKKIAFVLAQRTLDAFGVDTPKELVDLLKELSKIEWAFTSVRPVPFKDVSQTIDDGHMILDEKELTLRERLALSALNKSGYHIPGVIRLAGEEVEYRKLKIGVAEVSEAWTDGREYIVLHRNLLKLADKGVSGYFRIMTAIVHEYLHTGPDISSHLHDQGFYQGFHNALMFNEGYTLGDIAVNMEREYIKLLQENGEKLKKAQLTSMDRSAKLEASAPEDAVVSFESVPEAVINDATVKMLSNEPFQLGV